MIRMNIPLPINELLSVNMRVFVRRSRLKCKYEIKNATSNIPNPEPIKIKPSWVSLSINRTVPIPIGTNNKPIKKNASIRINITKLIKLTRINSAKEKSILKVHGIKNNMQHSVVKSSTRILSVTLECK
jgi:hypothetical protein